jgi:hypothetical protein
MRHTYIVKRLLFPFISTALLAAASQQPRRISSSIEDDQTFVLAGTTRPAVAQGIAQDRGPASGSQILPRLYIHFAMTGAQQADLQQLLSAQQDPKSANYHTFLTPEEYAARFGLNNADIESVKSWLQNQGFSNVEVARSQTWLSFSATVAQVRSAFQTSIHNYSLHGEMHFANATNLQLPKALEGVVESVRGLNSFHMKPQIHLRSQFTSSISGNTFLAPDDWATIYDVKPIYNLGLSGSGVSIAIVGQSDVQLSDIAAFRSAAGLAAQSPTVILAGADPGIVSGDEVESDLDLEWAGGMAPNANIIFITASATSGNGVDDSISYAIDNNVAPIISISYGACEADYSVSEINAQNTLFAQATAQGITTLVASGDSGAAACDQGVSETSATKGLAVNFPASSPYVTGVGGTRLSVGGAGTYWSSTNNGKNGSALSYIPEIVWNDGFQSASGGGVSARFAKPSWQVGTGVPADGLRDVPDVAFAADPDLNGYLFCGHSFCTSGFRNASSSLDVVGGTSAGTPSLAGVVALLIQKTGGRLGNINPSIYSLAATTPAAFHDVTSGNNIQTCRTGTTSCTSGQFGYTAGAGYDQTTGWGSLDAYNYAVAGTVVTTGPTSLQFVPVTPCRVVDTRLANGSFGGPELGAGVSRNFLISSGSCGIPSNAAAYSLNVTAVPDSVLGFLAIWPSGVAQPVVSTLNSDGRVKANAAIVPAGTGGGVAVYVSQASHVILDIDGYFVSGNSSALDFYPVTPCRVADTRSSTGALGGPSLSAGSARSFPILSSSCGIPATAQAYSLNLTAVPHSQLGFLATWPTGQSQPVVSTLNSPTGTVTANAAIVAAGTGGAVNMFASNDSDLVIDINGYFAPAVSGGLSLYNVTPCRALDTRNTIGQFSGTITTNVSTSSCSVPTTAQAFVLNATVVPPGPMQYITIWPSAVSQPYVSTLNAPDGAITSNMAIVPASSGSVNTFVTNPTQLILDIAAYFAP